MANPRHVANWWGPNGFTTTIEQMDVRPGGIWKHTMRGPDGAEYPNHSVFEEVVKPERIVFSHGGGLRGAESVAFVATWTFEDLGKNQTRLTARMVFPTAAARDVVVREYGAIEGGKQTLGRLAEYLPQIQSGNQPQDDFIISRTFDAPRDLVWKAWTERERFMQWFGPKGFVMPVADMDFRPGGILHYCLRSPDGMEMWGKFVYREIISPEKIVLVNSFSNAAGELTRHPFKPEWPLEMLMTTTFAEESGKTTVTIRWSPLNATEADWQAFNETRGGAKVGWTGTFEQLADYLAKNR